MTASEEGRPCAIIGCKEKAVHWYVHTGSGIRYMCEPHFKTILSAAQYRRMQIAHGTIVDGIPLAAYRAARRQ